MYKIEEQKKVDSEHRAQWQKLWESIPDAHFFNSPAWYQSYLDVFGNEKSIVFFCYQEKDLVGVIPLVLTKRYGIKALASIDEKYKFLDRSTILLAKKDPVLAGYLLKKIGQKYHLYLAELEEENVKIFKNSGQKQIIEFSTTCPRMSISEDVLANVSAKQKKSLCKKLRKNKKDISFEMHRDNLEEHLETIFQLEGKSHKRDKGISLFEKQHMRKLYRTLVKNGCENVGIAFLHYKGRPIAHRFGFFYRKTFLSVHVAFDDQFRKLGPGKLLLYHCLEYFRKNNVEILDFSVGNNYLKQQFADGKISQFHIFHSGSILVRTW